MLSYSVPLFSSACVFVTCYGALLCIRFAFAFLCIALHCFAMHCFAFAGHGSWQNLFRQSMFFNFCFLPTCARLEDYSPRQRGSRFCNTGTWLVNSAHASDSLWDRGRRFCDTGTSSSGSEIFNLPLLTLRNRSPARVVMVTRRRLATTDRIPSWSTLANNLSRPAMSTHQGKPV